MSATVRIAFPGDIELRELSCRRIVGLVALGASLGCSEALTDGPLYPVSPPANPGTPPPQPKPYVVCDRVGMRGGLLRPGVDLGGGE